MRTKRVLRHYCEHCSKGGFRKPEMARHEQSCVHNPERICWACQEFELDPEPLEKLIALADVLTHDHQDLTALDKAAQGCPACMLAAIVQSRDRFRADKFHSKEDIVYVAFNYKERMQAMHAEKNRQFQAYVGGF